MTVWVTFWVTVSLLTWVVGDGWLVGNWLVGNGLVGGGWLVEAGSSLDCGGYNGTTISDKVENES